MSVQKIDVLAVQKLAKSLDEAYAAKKKAEEDLKTIRGLGGQQGYSIAIHGVRVDVAEMDRYYNPKLIRGREMMHLGALKALQSVIDHWAAEVVRRENALAAIASIGGAK